MAESPALRVILFRAALFVFFASAIWALLPLVAQSQLHLGSGGYGLLLGCVGIGAVAGAALLPRLRSQLAPGTLLTAGPSVWPASPSSSDTSGGCGGGRWHWWSGDWPGSWPCRRSTRSTS